MRVRERLDWMGGNPVLQYLRTAAQGRDAYMVIFSRERHSADSAGLRHEKSMNQELNIEAVETVQTKVAQERRVRLCRFCAQKLGLWMEWKSNHCIYDHATTKPCDECQGANLRNPESIFTVRLSMHNAKAYAPAGKKTPTTQENE